MAGPTLGVPATSAAHPSRSRWATAPRGTSPRRSSSRRWLAGARTVALHFKATGDALREPPFDLYFPDRRWQWSIVHPGSVHLGRWVLLVRLGVDETALSNLGPRPERPLPLAAACIDNWH